MISGLPYLKEIRNRLLIVRRHSLLGKIKISLLTFFKKYAIIIIENEKRGEKNHEINLYSLCNKQLLL